MRITVVTVTRNLIDAGLEDSFRETVASVRRQSHDDVEYVVADGGSTDGTAEIIAGLHAAGAIDRHVSEPDTGIYQGMNRGLALARGDYVLFLNADDYYHDAGGLARVAAAAERSGADMIASPIVVLDTPPRVKPVNPGLRHAFRNMPFGHPGLAVRRDVLNRLGGFDESFRISGDFDLIVRLVLSGASYQVIEDPFVSFRLGGISETRAELREEERLRVWTKNFRRYDWRDRPFEMGSNGRPVFPSRVCLGLALAPDSLSRTRAIAVHQLLWQWAYQGYTALRSAGIDLRRLRKS